MDYGTNNVSQGERKKRSITENGNCFFPFPYPIAIFPQIFHFTPPGWLTALSWEWVLLSTSAGLCRMLGCHKDLFLHDCVWSYRFSWSFREYRISLINVPPWIVSPFLKKLSTLQICAVELQWKCIKKTVILKNYNSLLLTFVCCFFYQLKIVI